MICFSELLFLNLYVKFLWCRYSGFFVCYIKLLIMYMFVLMSSNAFRACYFFLPINGRAGTTFLFFLQFLTLLKFYVENVYFYYFSFYFWFLCQRKFIICVKCSVLFFVYFIIYLCFFFFSLLFCTPNDVHRIYRGSMNK